MAKSVNMPGTPTATTYENHYLASHLREVIMFEYLHDGKRHTDTTNQYMQSLGLDADTRESIINQQQFELEQKAAAVRSHRDKRIAVTDFYLLPDTPTQPAGLASYRQALRDVPQQPGFPWVVEWPILWKPEPVVLDEEQVGEEL